MTTTLTERAIHEAGAYLEDCTDHDLPLAARLRACATASGLGSDGDYTDEERSLFLRAAEELEVG